MNGDMPMGMQLGRDLGLLLPQIAVLLTAVAALVAEMLRRPRWALVLTVAGLLAAAVLAAGLLGTRTTAFMGTYRIDDLSLWATLILAPATALCAILAAPEVGGTDREGTVYSLLSFTALGALVLAGAGDTMFLVLGVLLSSLGSFALVAYPRDDRATEAAVKYLVFGSVASAAMIYGLTFWYGATGSTLLAGLDRLTSVPLAAVGLLGVLVGLGYKAALAPFHFWAPDAYEGGPLAVAAFLSVVPKIGALFALAQVARSLPATPLDWRPVVAVLAVAAMVWGNLAALPQENIVRLLAYSSVAQSGYFLLGIVALGRSPLALQALVVFAAAYAAMNLGAFAIVASAGRDLATLSGFGRSAPWAGAALVVFLLSLVGVPPLAGFGGKLLLFGAALDTGYSWLAIVAILNSILSLAVYLRIIVPLYGAPCGVRPAARPAVAVWAIAFALTVGIGLAAQALVGRLT
jgi:proton-translocating NADH-quinone oxidoreductase chain N